MAELEDALTSGRQTVVASRQHEAAFTLASTPMSSLCIIYLIPLMAPTSHPDTPLSYTRNGGRQWSSGQVNWSDASVRIRLLSLRKAPTGMSR